MLFAFLKGLRKNISSCLLLNELDYPEMRPTDARNIQANLELYFSTTPTAAGIRAEERAARSASTASTRSSVSSRP